MNELTRKAVINFVSISTVLVLMIVANYENYTMERLLGNISLLAIFSVACTAVTLGISKFNVFNETWGNGLSVFISIMVVAVFWTLFSAISVLFVVMAVPSAVVSLVLWKVWKCQSNSSESAKAYRQ